MAQDTLNKKLAQWAGIKYEPDEDEFKVIFPDGDWYNIGHDWELKDEDIEPRFTQSLDACFQWLTPKLIEMDCYIQLNNGDYWTGEIWERAVVGRNTRHIGEAETPALALCLAVEKLIDEKDSTSS